METQIADRIEAERRRLLAEAGLDEKHEHFRRPHERPFTATERAHTTVLLSGLTLKHERFVVAALQGLGYKCDNLAVPDVRSFQLGKEYGNGGQCSPTYFTVGNLVKHLQGLRDSGMPKERIAEDFVFLTAGGCGPCRFGMYEAEYRIALRNAGFEDFRVILFSQTGGLSQGQMEAGLRMDLDFFLSIISALAIGDLLNEVGYQIRPFEIEKGATDAALQRCQGIIEGALRDRSFASGGGKLKKFWSYLFTDHFTKALGECRAVLDAVEVDRTRLLPVVKVTGEFWAQTTEGDGNYKMFRFLEGEGAEVIVEPIMTWINYLLWQVGQGARHRYGSEGRRNPLRHWALLAKLSLAGRLLNRHYERFRKALGGTAHRMINQLHLQRLGHPHYNANSQGGEGHLEVAKNIYYHNKNLAHMVLSLKPFGCMPSTQSDGAQAAVVSLYPDMIYLPIETSGEGEINAHSRVQMALGEARRKTREELA
ncbi:MAG: activator of (R)-2-hydroxyglutaryl-CoA dehydratase, partial [Planctomycetes bacterium]|nr:activator of (R)-2-hydroxyglutaryl-CoA dehydratase [Planctomycetota bacterium]